MPKLTAKPMPIDLYSGPALATLNEISLTIRRSRSSIRRDMDSGLIKSIKVGNSRRIIVASVREMIEAAA